MRKRGGKGKRSNVGEAVFPLVEHGSQILHQGLVPGVVLVQGQQLGGDVLCHLEHIPGRRSIVRVASGALANIMVANATNLPKEKTVRQRGFIDSKKRLRQRTWSKLVSGSFLYEKPSVAPGGKRLARGENETNLN